MSTKKDDESLTILKNLAILIFLFYLLQYIVCLILAASFDLWSYQPLGGQNGQFSVGVLPFWHYECGIQQGNVALTSWLSMVISQIGLTGWTVSCLYVVYRIFSFVASSLVLVSLVQSYFVFQLQSSSSFEAPNMRGTTQQASPYYISVSHVLLLVLHRQTGLGKLRWLMW
mmetsp:Transcript_89197/g.238184  ORF Transcript_89197/g.238184 Transcript_89197/m.238184 type:complete len:171 (-) Transcript_89197:509-1021(-)